MCLGGPKPAPAPRPTPAANTADRAVPDRLPLLAPPPPSPSAVNLDNPDDNGALEFDAEAGAFFIGRRGAERLRIPLIPLSKSSTLTRAP